MSVVKTQLARAIIGVLGVGAASVAGAQAPSADRKPKFAFSIAHRDGQHPNGPLFEKAKAALLVASYGTEAGFREFLSKDAGLKLLKRSETGGPESVALSIETIKAADRSCLGPYSYDEGSTWAQLSWICRVDKDAPLSNVLSFRDSPELSLTVWFKDGFITEIVAMEPLPIPGRSLPAMDAYSVMKAAK